MLGTEPYPANFHAALAFRICHVTLFHTHILPKKTLVFPTQLNPNISGDLDLETHFHRNEPCPFATSFQLKQKVSTVNFPSVYSRQTLPSLAIQVNQGLSLFTKLSSVKAWLSRYVQPISEYARDTRRNCCLLISIFSMPVNNNNHSK